MKMALMWQIELKRSSGPNLNDNNIRSGDYIEVTTQESEHDPFKTVLKYCENKGLHKDIADDRKIADQRVS